MTLKNNRAPILCYVKLCASFQNHQIQIQFKIFLLNIERVYIEMQEYETQMGLSNSIIMTRHVLIFDLYFALGRNKLG